MTTAVHAPHPPSAHPSFVPVNPIPRRYSSKVHSGSGCSRVIFVPLTQKIILSFHPAVMTCNFCTSSSFTDGDNTDGAISNQVCFFLVSVDPRVSCIGVLLRSEQCFADCGNVIGAAGPRLDRAYL